MGERPACRHVLGSAAGRAATIGSDWSVDESTSEMHNIVNVRHSKYRDITAVFPDIFVYKQFSKIRK